MALGTMKHEAHGKAGNHCVPVEKVLTPSAGFPEAEETALVLVTCGE